MITGAIKPASKAAIEQMTRTWAAECGPHVNTVAPGATATLVSGEARYAHGTVLDIDGGIANTRLGDTRGWSAEADAPKA